MTDSLPPVTEGSSQAGPDTLSEDRFRLLFVCTGNICRSPLAERLAYLWLGDRLGPDFALFDVTSAGVHGLEQEPMDPYAASNLRALGGDPAGFLSRPLTFEQVSCADLIVGMTREHRAAAVRRSPASVRYAFTLRELARLAEAVDDGYPPFERGPKVLPRARQVVETWCAARGSVIPAAPEEDDIEDPIGRPPSVHERVAGQIADSLGVIVGRIAG